MNNHLGTGGTCTKKQGASNNQELFLHNLQSPVNYMD